MRDLPEYRTESSDDNEEEQMTDFVLVHGS